MSTAPYNDIADWYDEYTRERPIYHEVLLPGLFELMPDIRGHAVCDLACGTGLLSRELAKHGAQVTGVDLAEKMLEVARRHEEVEPLGIRYLEDDAHTLATLPDAVFDGATCSMGLMNINDLNAAFRALRRVLKIGGWFVFSITHPCFETPGARWVDAGNGMIGREVTGYFRERLWQSVNSEGVRGRVAEHHRMLSTYVNTLIDAGFVLERLSEPQATGRRAEQVPGNREIPSILLMRARSI
jgi:ubiquinone/menaquinone biosynthesis C-methylase UbiE